MSLFSKMQYSGHEQVIFHKDEATSLRAIVAIHSTALGPALGGLRWYPDENEAISDVLRLAVGMTNKSALAGLNFGGGKAVVIGDPSKKKYGTVKTIRNLRRKFRRALYNND